MTTIALTGRGGGRLADADILMAVPSSSTPRIQELHTCIYHYVCEQVERRLSAGAGAPSTHRPGGGAAVRPRGPEPKEMERKA